MTENFQDFVFRERVDKCLEKTRLLLHQTKRLAIPEDVAHQYNDKYLVAEYLTNSAIGCFSSSLIKLGLSASNLTKLVSWARTQDVSLRLEVTERCVFLKETKRDLASATRNEVNVTGFSMITGRQITTVTENLYTFTAYYELVAFRGVGDKLDDRIVLQSRNSQQDITTASRSSPYPTATTTHFDVNISWLLRCMDNKLMQIAFSIDREMKECHTPSRNSPVFDALDFFQKFNNWGANVGAYFIGSLFEVQLKHTAESAVRQDLQSINTDDMFVPVVPLMCVGSSYVRENGDTRSDDREETTIQTVSNGPSVTLDTATVSQLLSEHARSLDAKCSTLMQLFPSVESSGPATGLAGSQGAKSPIITVAEAKLLVIILHLNNVGVHYADGIQHLENLLRQQLVAAVGKTLQASDFTAYMRYHNRKLFKNAFQPRPFSHAVRRTVQHSPEGSFRIEEQSLQGSMSEPIYTACCSRSASEAAPMQFALDASTNVTFGGDRHLHTWLSHSFSGQQLPKLTLVAQARQFSSFIVLIGRIASANVFEPKYGMIVQDKDEVSIPLNLERLPTPKEFRDAIESLSPEQQRFAKAFRGMQLEGTLLGVLVLPIKPQLEVVLKLPLDSLSKEIRLTQQLMELFIKHQIPSDLLSFDEKMSSGNTPTARLDVVKEHVKGMLLVISEAKANEIKEKLKEETYNGPPFSFGGGVPSRASRSGPAPFQAQGVQCSPPPGLRFSFGPLSNPCEQAACFAETMTARVEKDVSTPNLSDNDHERNGSSNEARTSNLDSSVYASCSSADAESGAAVDGREVMDFTKYAGLLDRRYEELDPDSALRPTIINPSDHWTKKSSKSLMSAPVTTQLTTSELVDAKHATFELLDALTRSGALVMESASLHVLIAATHCFDKSLMDTVVQGNVNPIERVERSAVIMTTTIHRLPASALLSGMEVQRVLSCSPQLQQLEY